MRSRWSAVAVIVVLVVGASSAVAAGADSTGADVVIPPPLVLGGDGGPSAAQPAPSAGLGYAAPASIPADCSRDVSAEVNAWIASVPDHATARFATNGCYRVDGRLIVRGRTGLTIEGNGSTFRQVTDGRELGNAARERGAWTFFLATDLRVRNMTVMGPNTNPDRTHAYVPALEGQAAYTVGNSTGVVLENVAAFDVYGDFVFLGGRAHNVLVQNSTFARAGRQGWTINGENITFDHNRISQTPRSTIDIEPAQSSVVRHVTISNNLVGRGRLYFLANVGASAPVEDIQILNNTLVGKAMTIHVDPPTGYRYGFKVIGNVSDTPYGCSGCGLLRFQHVRGLEVRDNVQPVQRDRNISGVALRDVHGAVVTGNQFPRAIAPILSRGGNTDVTQSGNWVGKPPLTEFPPSYLAAG